MITKKSGGAGSEWISRCKRCRSALLQPDETEFEHLIMQTVRLPRVLAGALVGIALAEPGSLGVKAGAGLAAVSTIVWFKDFPVSLWLFFAFGGALLVALLIYVLAWK